MALHVGAPVGEYEVVKQLGAGAMGDVYEAIHPVIGKRVAIKVMKQPAAEALVEAQRLLEEARVVNAIRHAGIVDIFGANVLPDGRPYLVMELLEGLSLHDYQRKHGPLTIADVIELLDGVLEPLSAAHKAGVIHRDLKPTNVFVSGEGFARKVKLLDFGVAHRADRERLTAPEVTVGSLGFMGPEQLAGKTVPQSDLYAVGCCAWFLIVGDPVFPYRKMGELAQNHMKVVPPPIRTLRADVPADLERWVANLLEKEPTRRPANAFEALLSLRLLAEALDESTVLEPSHTPPSMPIRKVPSSSGSSPGRVFASSGSSPGRVPVSSGSSPGSRPVSVNVPVKPAAPPSDTLADDDDSENTVRIVPGKPRR